jgi:hypothetical protein
MSLYSPDYVDDCYFYSKEGRKNRAERALEELRRGVSNYSDRISSKECFQARRALSLLQQARRWKSDDYSERDNLILDWIECVLREQIKPVEIVMELPTDCGVLQPAAVFQAVKMYVQDIKLHGEPCERPAKNRPRKGIGERCLDFWLKLIEPCFRLTDYAHDLSIHNDGIGWFIVSLTATVIILSAPTLILLLACVYLMPYANPYFALSILCLLFMFFIAPLVYSMCEAVLNLIGHSSCRIDRSWGYALFFEETGYKELSTGGVSRMEAFVNIWNMTGLLLNEASSPRGYSRVPTLDVNENCSDIFGIIGFRSKDGERKTFRQVWEEMEEASKKVVSDKEENRYPIDRCDFVILG